MIEACPEDLALKRELFGGSGGDLRPEAVLATNTSSLPVTDIAAGVPRPERVCGMHFFNPPALMKLVEVVATADSAEAHLQAVEEVARAMGREPVRCTDSPGFIVNRCNRPFALESLRILDEGLATHAQIDEVMREEGGYPMGPFELMDLIGIDVNLEVARSFYRQRPSRAGAPTRSRSGWSPKAGWGERAARGFYDYAEGAMAPDGADWPRRPGAPSSSGSCASSPTRRPSPPARAWPLPPRSIRRCAWA